MNALTAVAVRTQERRVATLTIRKLDDRVKEALRLRAARAGRSMEDEARSILTRAVRGVTGPELLERASSLFGPEGGVDRDEAPLDAPRDVGRQPVDFGQEEPEVS